MNDNEINELIATRDPPNTVNTKRSHWKVFSRFLAQEKPPLVLDLKTATDQTLNLFLKRFVFNVRKLDGENFKDESLKAIFNSVAAQLNDKIFECQNRKINIFEDAAFKEARDGKTVKRRDLQKDPLKRKVSASALTAGEAEAMINCWGIDTPEGLNRTIFHLGGFVLANRGNDQASWFLEDFEKELDNKGKETGCFIIIKVYWKSKKLN
jgi:hypothetical protein